MTQIKQMIADLYSYIRINKQSASICLICVGVPTNLWHPLCYPKKEINTPAATAEPITPEILLAMQYCKT